MNEICFFPSQGTINFSSGDRAIKFILIIATLVLGAALPHEIFAATETVEASPSRYSETLYSLIENHTNGDGSINYKDLAANLESEILEFKNTFIANLIATDTTASSQRRLIRIIQVIQYSTQLRYAVNEAIEAALNTNLEAPEEGHSTPHGVAVYNACDEFFRFWGVGDVQVTVFKDLKDVDQEAVLKAHLQSICADVYSAARTAAIDVVERLPPPSESSQEILIDVVKCTALMSYIAGMETVRATLQDKDTTGTESLLTDEAAVILLGSLSLATSSDNIIAQLSFQFMRIFAGQEVLPSTGDGEEAMTGAGVGSSGA